MITLLFCGLLLALALTGSLYLLASALIAWRFRRRAMPPGPRPALTVLKPLYGAAPGLADDLADVMAQDHPDFTVVYGVHNPDDPAAPVAQAVMAAHPAVPAVLVANPHRAGSNPKVSNLINMMPEARAEVLVVADADIAVPPGYLDQVAGCFTDPAVGSATCVYVGLPASTRLTDRLGAQFINHGFLPSVLVAEALGKLDGCFGATMAVRRTALDAIGGFHALKDRLADDYYLGHLVKQAGYKLVLAPVVVGHRVAESDFKTLIRHELRWSRTIRMIEPVGHALSVITMPVVPALAGAALALTLSPGAAQLGFAAVVWVLACRLIQVRVLDRMFDLPQTPFPTLFFRDCLSFAVHLAAFGSRRVRWNDADLTVDALGQIETK